MHLTPSTTIRDLARDHNHDIETVQKQCQQLRQDNDARQRQVQQLSVQVQQLQSELAISQQQVLLLQKEAQPVERVRI